MSKLDKDKSWLAAEYALGVAQGDARVEAQKLVERDASFRKNVDAWQNQLSPILDDVEDVTPPAALWKKIENKIAPAQAMNTAQTAGAGIWKILTGLMSTAAVACLCGLLYISGGDFSSGTVSDLKQRLAASDSSVATANTAFAGANERSEALKQEVARATDKFDVVRAELDDARRFAEETSQQLAQTNGTLEQANTKLADANVQVKNARQEVASAQAEVENLQQQFNSARPLVASLTQSGDAPAFMAQYDPLKKVLLIRTAVENNDDKVPEIWLIPAQGERKGEVLSLGVMNENAPDEVKITDEFVKLIGEGGTLAITMEPAGGSPTGVATGPVIALGQLQSF